MKKDASGHHVGIYVSKSSIETLKAIDCYLMTSHCFDFRIQDEQCIEITKTCNDWACKSQKRYSAVCYSMVCSGNETFFFLGTGY